MDVSPTMRRLIHTTAVGALVAGDIAILFAALGWAVPYTVFDPHAYIAGALPVLFLPVAVAALCMFLLELATGASATLSARRGQQGQWSTSVRVLLALAVVAPALVALVRDSLMTPLLVLVVALTYLVLPAQALLLIGRRSGPRLLAMQACVAYAMTIALLFLTLLYPRFGEDPHQEYDIYIPPQFSAALVVLIAGALFSVAAGIVCAMDSQLAGRRRWSNSFFTAVVAGLLGPFAVAMQVHFPPLISLSPTLEVVLAILSLASYLALPVMTLIYMHKPPASTSQVGVPGVGTSL